MRDNKYIGGVYKMYKGFKVSDHPYLHPGYLKEISVRIGLGYISEMGRGGEVCFADSPDVRPEYRSSFSSIDVLDYAYAVLHCSQHKERYKNFLRGEFTEVAPPKDLDFFWLLVMLGRKLRTNHFLEHLGDVGAFEFKGKGDNIVRKVEYREGKVFVNYSQYFENVPEGVWYCFIAYFQSSLNWLEEKTHQTLGPEEILHYQKILKALLETSQVMKEIDKVIGGNDDKSGW
jgi:hypothetical protein